MNAEEMINIMVVETNTYQKIIKKKKKNQTTTINNFLINIFVFNVILCLFFLFAYRLVIDCATCLFINVLTFELFSFKGIPNG